MFARMRLLLGQVAIHPLDTAYALSALPKYVRDLLRFRKANDWDVALYPCLFDRSASASTLGEYFWQDLYVARRILGASPVRHVDVGSRIDGFIAHLACQRQVEVYDIRPLDPGIPNVQFRRWDMTAAGPGGPGETADCVSCLHTLEHVGLGRYGDSVDPAAWQQGLRRLAGIVQAGGCLWLSVPVGRRRVEFNAHRVFDPRELRDFALSLGLELDEFSVVYGHGGQRFITAGPDWDRVASELYAVGIYLFRRPGSS
jgi:hypothetical protein